MKKEESLYQITCTEKQLILISKCVEDCCRFMSGQTGMYNTTSMLPNFLEAKEALELMHKIIVPQLSENESYGWSGGACPNKEQRAFIAQTYPIYREILHFLAIKKNLNDVYSSETLTCELGGKPIKIKEL